MVAFCFAGGLRTAQACTCSSPAVNDRDAAAAEFKDAAVVFEGEVSASPKRISAPTGNFTGLSMIEFRVLRAYKGNLGDSVQLFDPMAGTSCGLDTLKSGEKLFVYGFPGKDNKIYIQACTRTSSLESAGPDVRFARNEPPTDEDLAPPGERWRLYRDATLKTRGASIQGVVRRADGADASEAFVTVWEVDENGRRAGMMAANQNVRADGTFEIRFLAPGRYNVTAEDMRMNTTARYVGEYGNVVLAEHQVVSKVVVDLHADPLGTVGVRVIAPRELHDRIFVWLRDVEMDSFANSPYPYAQTAHLDEKGIASFEFVPFGRYEVYVMLNGDDLTKPSWIHDELTVRLNTSKAETEVSLYPSRKE